MHRTLIYILIPITFLLYAWPFFQWFSDRQVDPPVFKQHTHSNGIEGKPSIMKTQFITPYSDTRMVHAASICELGDGRLAAVYYGGSREGAKDVAVSLTLSESPSGSSWSPPRVIVDAAIASKELGRYIRKVGNPIIFTGPDQRLYLIYVTVTVGGWSGSSLNLKISEDTGTSWTKSRRLTLSPFFNVSELVRNKPVFTKDGRTVVPIYHECLGDFPELLWLNQPDGKGRVSYRKTRMTGGETFIQPCVVPYSSVCATAFYRCRTHKKKIGTAVTTDGGISWTSPRFLPLPNPDAGLDVTRLSNGRMLMAFNDTPAGRENLTLAVSCDQGITWQRMATLDNSPGREFSYPYMISTQTGRIHLVYTWRRKRIKHIIFNESWVNKQLGEYKK